MTTGEALEKLNDAEFELLAVRSLRELATDCHAVIHTGMNAQEKTVTSPLDGFCRVPGINPPRFVMIAATTTNLKTLKAKWLAPLSNEDAKPKSTWSKSGRSNKKNDAAANEGDLTKASKRAASLREQTPTASFILYLATNRALSLELENAARRAGEEAGLEVRFLEQSQLRDFLDARPLGQWLRQEHLGIEADQVSLPLLKKLCEENLSDYAKDVAIFDDFVPTKTKSSDIVLNRLKDPSVYFHLLVGSSGVGKSVTAMGALRSHLASGGVGIWLSSDAVEAALSLSEAIRAVLSARHPKLGRDAGISTMDLAAGHGPLVLVVDDINRSRAPLQLLKKLLSWMRPAASDSAGVQLVGRVHLVCPLWNSYRSSINSDAESSKWIEVLRLTRFTRPETIALLQTAPRPFLELEMTRYAEALEDDPILVGLFVRMLRLPTATDPMRLCHDAIASFIRSSANDLALSRGDLAESYALPIQELARQMVLHRSFHPTWSEVQLWFAQSMFMLQRLEAVAAQGHICRVRETNHGGVFEFRHDRLLEFCISQALEAILRGPETDWKQAFDPYHVPYLGRCMARAEFGYKVLDRVQQESPASLIASLRFLPMSSSDYSRRLVTRAATWFSKCRRSAAEMRHAVQLLREVETPFTLEVTESRKDDLTLRDARLRCGDAQAGALSLSYDFTPGSSDELFEQLIEEADARHHRALIDGTANILLRGTWNTPTMGGALTLAGYLSDAELGPSIAVCWTRAPAMEKKDILLQALWAALRCSGDNPRGGLAPLLEAVFLLKDTEESPSRLSERDRLLEALSHAGRHGYSVPVLELLVAVGNEERFERTVVGLLGRVDHPLAVRFMVTKLAWWSERAQQAKSFSPFANHWRENWEKRHGGSPISSASLAEMRLLWEDSQRPEWLRSYALSCWVELTPDIASLQGDSDRIPGDRASIWHRAKAGDRSVTEDYLAYLDEDWHWLYVMPEIWSQELLSVAGKWLGKIQDPSFVAHSDKVNALARVIRDIPMADGEALLVENWNILGGRKEFLQAALHVSSERTRELARRSLANWNGADDPFDRIDRYFFTGFNRISPDDRLLLRQVEGLAPYVDRLSTQVLGGLLDFCGKRGYLEFARTHLVPECRSRLVDPQASDVKGWLRRSLRDWAPIRQELAEELSRIVAMEERHWGIQIELMLEQFLKADQPLDAFFETLEAWLAETPEKDQYRISALIVRYWGKRGNLRMLESFSFANEAAAQQLLADSRYDVFKRSLE